jgi:hypothetical protein
MKIGVFVEKAHPVQGFDLKFCHTKNALGQIYQPTKDFYNVFSCFGDNINADKSPEQIAISPKGKASRKDQNYHFIWDWLCPTNPHYQENLHEQFRKASTAKAAGVHLYCIGFPREEFCTCPRCTSLKNASGLDWSNWRSKVVVDFIKAAKQHINVPLSILLPTEPFALKERLGIDLDKIGDTADFFLEILYDLSYDSIYWLEDTAFSLRRRITKPLYIQLYAGPPQPSTTNIFRAMTYVAPYCDGIVLFTGNEDVAELQRNFVKNKDCWTMAKKYPDLQAILSSWKGLYS